MKIYTKRGDDGTTTLRGGSRIPKDHPLIELNGTIDEAQSALGVARADCEPGGELDQTLKSIERDLWTVMADIAVAREKGRNHSDQQCGVDTKMVEALEELIDDFSSRSSMPHDFTVPGETRCSAALDLARTIVRRAERLASTLDLKETILMYLNRLSDVCWTLARYEEGTSVLAKDHHASVRPHQRDTQDPKGRDIGAKD